MKTILRIIVILIVASFVAGAISLAVNNMSLSSGEGSQPPAMTSVDGQSFQPGERSEGGSITGGLVGVLTTLMKIAGITLVIVLLQKALSQLRRPRWKLAQR